MISEYISQASQRVCIFWFRIQGLGVNGLQVKRCRVCGLGSASASRALLCMISSLQGQGALQNILSPYRGVPFPEGPCTLI